MKEFFKDYNVLLKGEQQFIKKHWKGVALIYAITFGVTYGLLTLKDKREEREMAEWNRKMFERDSEEEA